MTKPQTSNLHPAYSFCGKPAFPVLGVRHKDSIDWSTLPVCPFSYTERHMGGKKSQKAGDKAHKPSERQRVMLRNVTGLLDVPMGSIAE